MRIPYTSNDNLTDGSEPRECDPRVAHALRSVGCNFQLTPSGDYILGFELTTGRHHTVIVNSRTAQIGIREMRCVFACGHASEDPLSSEVTTDLLRRNADYHVGAWEIAGDDEMQLALLSACVPADAPAVELLGVALHIARTADDVEETLTGDDRF